MTTYQLDVCIVTKAIHSLDPDQFQPTFCVMSLCNTKWLEVGLGYFRLSHSFHMDQLTQVKPRYDVQKWVKGGKTQTNWSSQEIEVCKQSGHPNKGRMEI